MLFPRGADSGAGRFAEGVAVWLTRSVGIATALIVGCLAVTGVSARQSPLSLHHFEGWQEWPVLGPGDLELADTPLGPMRLEFDGRFPGPDGFGRGPLVPLTMYMDVLPTRFHDRPATWVQWTSKPLAGGGGAPALDLLVVDRASFELLFRIGASARGAWTGRYEFVNAKPEGLLQLSVDDDGSVATSRLDGTERYFDFATYPFLFPLMDLKPGRSFRLEGYDYLSRATEILAVRVVGQIDIRDAHGSEHRVWRVDVMPPHRATLISFYVTKSAPFFYGWDYRVTHDGSMALQLVYRGWASTDTQDAAKLEILPLDEELRLALSAAPEHLRSGAAVYALTADGFVKAREGTNGFTCVVNRDHPLSRKPTCYDSEGARTILPKVMFVGQLLLEGVELAEIDRRVNERFEAGDFVSPSRPGVAYMLSSEIRNYNPQTDQVDGFPPHMMFYAPGVTNADIGTSWEALRVHPWLPFVAYEGPHGFFVVVVNGEQR